jgi:hypothetical protein
MADRTCPKCGRVFSLPCRFKDHLGRKTPCEPIINKDEESEKQKPFRCRYCGRGFAAESSMYRHVRQSCKIANTEEGMDKLMDHTIQRQLAEQGHQLARVTALLEEQQMALASLAAGGGAEGRVVISAARPTARLTLAAAQVNNGPVTNHVDARRQILQQTQVNAPVTVNITAPWDSDRRLNIGIKDMIAAFAENPRLREFARLPDHQMADHEIGGPFVIELFMDLVRRAHADPTMRNVYLNPRRTDQVLVYHDGGHWEVFPLPDSIRLLLDGVSEKIRPIILTPGLCGQLPLEAQNALAMAGMLYEETPDAYARKARGLMSAHLANMAPAAVSK